MITAGGLPAVESTGSTTGVMTPAGWGARQRGDNPGEIRPWGPRRDAHRPHHGWVSCSTSSQSATPAPNRGRSRLVCVYVDVRLEHERERAAAEPAGPAHSRTAVHRPGRELAVPDLQAKQETGSAPRHHNAGGASGLTRRNDLVMIPPHLSKTTPELSKRGLT